MEMLTPFMLYLFTRLDVIGVTCLWILCFCVVGAWLGIMYYSVQFGRDQENCWIFFEKYKIIKRVIVARIVSLLVLVIVPSKKDMILILGVPELVSTAKDITNSPRTSKALEYLDTYLDKELKSIKEEKK